MDTQETIGTLIDKSKDFLETKIEIARLKTISKSADILSTVCSDGLYVIYWNSGDYTFKYRSGTFSGQFDGIKSRWFFCSWRFLRHYTIGFIYSTSQMDQNSHFQGTDQ